MVKKSEAIIKTGKRKGKLKKGYRYAKGGVIVKAKKNKKAHGRKKMSDSAKLKKHYEQVGRTTASRDKTRQAKRPGYRRSKSGRVYFENRANRSDKNKKSRL